MSLPSPAPRLTAAPRKANFEVNALAACKLRHGSQSGRGKRKSEERPLLWQENVGCRNAGVEGQRWQRGRRCNTRI